MLNEKPITDALAIGATPAGRAAAAHFMPSICRTLFLTIVNLISTKMLFACLLVTSGCVSYDTLRLPLSNVSALEDLRLVQKITLNFEGEERSFLGVVESSNRSTKLAIFTPIGLNIFSIEKIQGKPAKLQGILQDTTNIDPELIISAVQLVNWPTKALSRGLPEEWRVSETLKSRELWRGARLVQRVEFLPQKKRWLEAKVSYADKQFELTITQMEPQQAAASPRSTTNCRTNTNIEQSPRREWMSLCTVI